VIRRFADGQKGVFFCEGQRNGGDFCISVKKYTEHRPEAGQRKIVSKGKKKQKTLAMRTQV